MDERRRDIAYFVSFCIEQYKNAKGLTGEEAMTVLEKYGLLDYLQRHFDVLHTQGHRWLLTEMDEFIDKRKQEAKEVKG
ncbi:MAG: DUF3791 domain-containing protein [Prevotellaceae bacterium]|nr:DUF3791 domain-containing protein [Prevotellaceae bacterium]